MSLYRNPPLVTHSVADEVLGATLGAGEPILEAADVLVGLALYDEDRASVSNGADESPSRALCSPSSQLPRYVSTTWRGDSGSSSRNPWNSSSNWLDAATSTAVSFRRSRTSLSSWATWNANQLAELGRREEAAELAREALDLDRRQAKADP